MLDDILDYLETVRERPVWQPIPNAVRDRFREPLPRTGTPLSQVHAIFMDSILPYAIGNAHPGFVGWVHGGGNPVGMLAEMLAAGLNANLGGRDHIPIEVEAQILRWMIELLRFPEQATGLFLTGSSMANLVGVLVARTRANANADARGALTAYTSARAHGCIARAMDIVGLRRDQLRMIPVDEDGCIGLQELADAIDADRAAGLTPFLLVGTAGTVDTGAIDNLDALAQLSHGEQLHFHVDGAFGAFGMLDPDIASRLCGIERADSIAFDFHKWLQVPYDAGFVLVRDRELHLRTFANGAQAYLQREDRGTAAGSPWPCDFGPDLSRGFRALKTWFSIKVYGSERLGQVISGSCALARQLAQCVAETPALELLAPVSLNIVCFRYVGDRASCTSESSLNRLNADLVVALQESGLAVPSSTVLDGRLALRVALFNHRTTVREIDTLLDATLRLGSVLEARTASVEEN